MNNILSEKEYQNFIVDYLENENGYVVRDAKHYDRLLAMDSEILFDFLKTTQKDVLEKLEKKFKDDTKETIINYLNNQINNSSLLEVLKHGVEIANTKIELMYNKPANDFNKDLVKKYSQNIFTVMEEVRISDKERIDLVIFLNGLAIMSFELKCNISGQSYKNAILQYRTERNHQNRLFLFKIGCIVNFAMDLEEVHMTTKLTGNDTFFLPFNMGSGEGVNAGKGNPIFKDKYSVSYMWEDILKKDMVLELIKKFVFIESKEKNDEVTGKKIKKETVIFPRYHQLDVIRKILSDIHINKTDNNYLIQHSAGSGKTNSIAWLAHRLSSMHDIDNNIIYDNIVIVTDRVIVDRQLQEAILGMEHKSGLIKVMDNKCTSSDLELALKGNTKIIATTIQKFPYIVDNIGNMKNKKFAVIIDEAHSSTSGKQMSAITKVLGAEDIENVEEIDIEKMISYELSKNGKQQNVSMFAFTATPKDTTIQQFGTLNKNGQMGAFHIYSMKQAIEEGFILDVLQNFTEYETYYQINKEIAEDPRCKTNEAKRQIARFAELHETNILQRIEIIIEHFRIIVSSELGGKAKAMVITSSREGAVKYRQAFEEYIGKKGYKDIKALVAFSGKVTFNKENKEYTEVGMNGFSEDILKEEFDKDLYKVLLVADKYQTGFDQPKLCAMYIMKKLKSVSAVQTLSRLNRTCLPYNKKTFILDFVNKYEDIIKAFEPYYTTTLLANTVRPSAIYDLEAKIDGYAIIDPDDIEKVNKLLYKETLLAKDKSTLTFLLQKTRKILDNYEIKAQREFLSTLKGFVRFYEFIIQVSAFEDILLHKKYNYISYLIAFINISDTGMGYDLDGKIKALNFVQKKGDEHKSTKLISDPVISLPIAEKFALTEIKEKNYQKLLMK